MDNNKKKKRVVVGMSGGVDSSVAAAVLKDQGYDVVGVFMHFWHENIKGALSQEAMGIRENGCCSLESQEAARKVAQILDIPLYTANAEKEFKKEVVDYFVREYEKGRTPNPCVVCNREIKFKTLFRKMMELEADFVATGHYALTRKLKIKNSKFKVGLFQSVDKEKDQSYFLYALTREQLARTIFPIGEFASKDEVRKYAKKKGLPVFSKKDSQDICFVPDSTADFLKRNVKMKPGDIVDADGNVLGRHEGLPLYTLGQRKGIKIGGDGPYFVAGKDASRNDLIVANSLENTSGAYVSEVNWIRKPSEFPLEALVRTRYRNPLSRVTIIESGIENKALNSSCKIVFNEPQRAVTPGQSAVFYTDDGEVIGGGIIA